MGNLAQFNDKTKFLLVAIDGCSKKAWVETMLNKSTKVSLKAITSILNKTVTPPKAIFFDRGKEFVNKAVYTFLRQKNIKVLHPNSEIKAAIAERFNRSLQDLIYKYLTENETRRYVDVLDDLLVTYNNRGHRTLKYMSPNEAELGENKNHVISALNEHYTKIAAVKTCIKFKMVKL